MAEKKLKNNQIVPLGIFTLMAMMLLFACGLKFSQAYSTTTPGALGQSGSGNIMPAHMSGKARRQWMMQQQSSLCQNNQKGPFCRFFGHNNRQRTPKVSVVSSPSTALLSIITPSPSDATTATTSLDTVSASPTTTLSSIAVTAPDDSTTQDNSTDTASSVLSPATAAPISDSDSDTASSTAPLLISSSDSGDLLQSTAPLQ